MNLYNENGVLVKGNVTRALQEPNVLFPLGAIGQYLLI